MRLSRRRSFAAAAVVAVAVAVPVTHQLAGASNQVATLRIAPTTAKHVGHVFTVMLENSEYEETFVAGRSQAPYLTKTLPAAGALIQGYYGTGHSSLDNYIAMTSGQGPNRETQNDCDDKTVLGGGKVTFGAFGQLLGQSGCTYPKQVKSITDQLDGVGKTWKAYMQGMDAEPAKKRTTCRNPYSTTAGMPDKKGHVDPKPSYKDKHNPWAYYHSTFERQAYCDQHVVPMGYLDGKGAPAGQLVNDLKSVKTTANYTYITPDQCHDAHDSCYGDQQLQNADAYLQKWIPVILNSPAFKQDGLLIITFDEGTTNLKCCKEYKAPNLGAAENNGFPIPVSIGDGGGRTGAIFLSPFIKGGTQDFLHSFNHYSYLRSIEDLFGVKTGGADGKGHLGYAATPGLVTFQAAGLIPQ